jgi:hypothetical protein
MRAVRKHLPACDLEVFDDGAIEAFRTLTVPD